MRKNGGGIIVISQDEVREMIKSKLKAEGISQEVMAVQIGVEQPFADGLRHHNEVPTLTVILANAGM